MNNFKNATLMTDLHEGIPAVILATPPKEGQPEVASTLVLALREGAETEHMGTLTTDKLEELYADWDKHMAYGSPIGSFADHVLCYLE